ncbi:MAG TPA: hypothetical protein VMF89_32565, partial [Polyangiales bacterium]|nr:hypothetical protein [Polyangiales bacterium]
MAGVGLCVSERCTQLLESTVRCTSCRPRRRARLVKAIGELSTPLIQLYADIARCGFGSLRFLIGLVNCAFCGRTGRLESGWDRLFADRAAVARAETLGRMSGSVFALELSECGCSCLSAV